MKKIILINLIIICNSFSIFALPDYPAKKDSIEQTKTVEKKNLSFVEVGGNGLVLSINYERYFTNNLSSRIGYGFLLSPSAFFHSFPLMFNYNFVKPFELGIGIVPYTTVSSKEGLEFFGEKKDGVIITATIGFKRINKGFVARFSLTPFYNIHDSKIKLFGGISFGIVF